MTRDFVVAVDKINLIPKPPDIFITRGPTWWRRFLGRILPSVFRVLGAETRLEFKSRRFTLALGDTIIKRLCMQQRDMRMIYDRQAEWLFVGPEAFDNVQDELMAVTPLGCQQFRLNGLAGIKVMDINIMLIPWMEGYLLVPKLK